MILGSRIVGCLYPKSMFDLILHLIYFHILNNILQIYLFSQLADKIFWNLEFQFIFQYLTYKRLACIFHLLQSSFLFIFFYLLPSFISAIHKKIYFSVIFFSHSTISLSSQIQDPECHYPIYLLSKGSYPNLTYYIQSMLQYIVHGIIIYFYLLSLVFSLTFSTFSKLET